MASAITAASAPRSDAAWNDQEHVSGTVAAISCANAENQFVSRSDGQLVSGRLAGLDLDSLAEVAGMTVTNDASKATPSPSGQQARHEDGSIDENGYVNPLAVNALDGLSVDLGNGSAADLTALLNLPLDNRTGVLNQYGRAASDGSAAAASGLVTDSGDVGTGAPGGYPHLAALDLMTLVRALQPQAATGLSSIANASLSTGAVAGRAALDGCDAAYSGVNATTLKRDYLASDLGLTAQSSTVGDLVDAAGGAITGVATKVDQLTSNAGVIDSVKSGVASLLNPILGGLSLGAISASVSATIDLTPVNALLTERFSDDEGLLTVDLAHGTIMVDLAAVLATAYPDTYANGLNALAPNTSLLINSKVVSALVAALREALNDWLGRVNSALTAAIGAATITSTVVISLTLPNVLGIQVPVADVTASVAGSLNDMLNGRVPANVKTNILNSVLLGGLVGVVTGPITEALTSGLGGIVGSAVSAVLTPLSTLGTTVTGLAEPIVTALGTLTKTLFVNDLVSVTVNAQNDTLSGGEEPADWADLPKGQYDVAALRIGILDALGPNGVSLYLGRAAVGPVCSLASATHCW